MSSGSTGPNTSGPPGGGSYVARHFAVTGEPLRRASGWLLFLGILLIVLGTFALLVPLFATAFIVLVYGWVLLFAGVGQIVGAFAVRLWGGFFLHLMMGIIDIVLGLIFLRNVGLAAAVVTLLLAASFLVGGAFRLVAAFSMRFPNWGWTALSGAVSVLLGILLFAWYPLDALTIPGLFVGVQMLFFGWSSVMLALAARSHPW
jgi:uncharacterized membrane protein HdeD (DUF308 family)